MTATLQPWLLDTGTAILEVAVARPLPINRVQIGYHPDGYQVQVVRGEQVETLPTVFEHVWDAEERAAVVAVRVDAMLYLGDREVDWESAEGLMMGVEWRDEIRDAETRWMR